MEKYIKEHKKWIDEVWERLDKKLSKTAVKSREKVPYTTVDGVHDNKIEEDAAWWTNGFWGGLMWIMYLGTQKEEYKKTAERAEEILDKAFEHYDGLHHDVGFMWNITSGTNYRITGNAKSKNRFCTAAALLASRFNSQGGYIRAWNGKGHVAGITIIDSMMNIPMLYRASEEVKDERFNYIAKVHAQKTISGHINSDGSVNHIVVHNPVTGEVERMEGGQGYGIGSAWSRGQAWAIYGFVLSYIHTKNEEYLSIAKRVAHYFIANLGINNYLPLVDFRSPEKPIIYDSTAGACAACGLIEIAKAVPEFEKKIYIDAAIKLLVAMEKEFCDWSDDEDSVLQKGTEAYNWGIHKPIIYGDFFFAEAIFKLRGNDFLIW